MGINTDAEMGQLARQYNENEQHIAEYRATIGEAVANMSKLSKALQTKWPEVTTSGDAYLVNGGSKVIKLDFLSTLPQVIKEIQTAMEDKENLEVRLRQARMEGLIKNG